jgi:hypothetical protein
MHSANQAAFDAGYQYVHQQMTRGVRDDAIYQSMVAEGWDPSMVRTLIANIRQAPTSTQQPTAHPPATPYGMPQQQQPATPQINYYTPQAQQRPVVESGGGGGGGADMAIGALICIVGIVITAGSYMAASGSSGGGRYVIAWGAIVFGAIRFFKGMAGR